MALQGELLGESTTHSGHVEPHHPAPGMECVNERLKGLEARAAPVAQQERRLGCRFSPRRRTETPHWEPPHRRHAHRIRGRGPLDCTLFWGPSPSLAVECGGRVGTVAGSPTGEAPEHPAASEAMELGIDGRIAVRMRVAQSTVMVLVIPSACMV